MKHRPIISAILAAAIIGVPTTRASADAGDFVAGAIIGGVLGHAVRNQPQKKVYRSTKSTKKVYRPTIPATQAGREIQTSLNYFGFNAGGVDGQLGRKSRDAISRYQAYMGYPVTGNLTTFEQDLLISSYNRAQAGGYATQQQIAAQVDGPRGLLKVYRAEMAGGTAVQPGTTMVVAPTPVPVAPVPAAPQTQMVAAPAPQPIVPVAPAAVTAAAAPAAAATGPLPSLFGDSAAPKAALADRCQAMGLEAGTSFAFTPSDRITNPDFALSQQFCVARAFAIASGDALAQSLGASEEQIASLCDVYAQRMAPFVAAVEVANRDAVQTMAAGFVGEAGLPEAQLAGTAQVCLGHGYASGDSAMAIGSALLLVGTGQDAYGEILGHHLHAGEGVAENASRAEQWFDASLSAAETDPVFAPSQPDRLKVMSAVLFPDRAVAVPASAPALPTFSITE